VKAGLDFHPARTEAGRRVLGMELKRELLEDHIMSRFGAVCVVLRRHHAGFQVLLFLQLLWNSYGFFGETKEEEGLSTNATSVTTGAFIMKLSEPITFPCPGETGESEQREIMWLWIKVGGLSLARHGVIRQLLRYTKKRLQSASALLETFSARSRSVVVDPESHMCMYGYISQLLLPR